MNTPPEQSERETFHALLAESDDRRVGGLSAALVISIHALLAESDARCKQEMETYKISIHALLAESDPILWDITNQYEAFLSTLSLRRATMMICLPSSAKLPFLSTLSLRRATVQLAFISPLSFYFYPRSPCGERQLHFLTDVHVFRISIHALLAESDAEMVSRSSMSCQFLSTLSLRRATGT